METPTEYTTNDAPYTIRDARTERRFFVDNVIIREYGPIIGVYGIAVYSALCMHANKDSQRCWPSHKTIAKEIGCSASKVKESLQQLAKLKLIAVEPHYEKQRQTSNTYTLLDPPSHHVPPVTTDTPPPYTDKATMNNPHIEQSPEESVTVVTAADASPEKPKTPSKPPRAKKTTPAAVKMFRNATARYPSKSWYNDIATHVGQAEDDLKFWYRVCHAWVGLGWNPTNVKGMLEFYRQRQIPPGRPKGVSKAAGDWIEENGFRAVPQGAVPR